MTDVSSQPHFLYRVRPTRPAMLTEGPTAREQEIIARHFEYLKDLTERGQIRLVGRVLTTDENGIGLAVLRVDTEAAARALADGDPAVREGVMTADVFPFRVVLVGN
jgi:uncharacterized protein YciI